MYSNSVNWANSIRNCFAQIYLASNRGARKMKVVAILLILMLVVNVESVFSHGTVVYPPSRIYNCYTNPSTSICGSCGDAIYNWMGVLQPHTDYGNHQAYVPDGQIASGGNGGGDFSCLDALTSDWSATSVPYGNIDVKWENTAPHQTEYYKVYITPLDWDPTQPLRWNDLMEIGHVGAGPAQEFTIISSYIPDSYAGKRAALVSVWQRDYNHSHEAFYAVSDIWVEGNGTGCNTGDVVSVTFANQTDCTLDYYQNNTLQGSASIGGTYQANTTVGSLWEARSPSGTTVDGYAIVCEQSTYTSTGSCGNTDGCSHLETWSASATYVGGDQVAHNGIAYEAKWWNQSQNPEQNSGQYQVWENLGPCADNICSPGDPLNVTFNNNTDCELQYYQNNTLEGTAIAGSSFSVGTTVGSNWEARRNSGEVMSSFAIVCEQTSYSTAGNCNPDTGGCATAYGPYPNIYMKGDVVGYNGRNYESQVDNLYNVTPGTADHWWKDLGPCPATAGQHFLLYPVPTTCGKLNVRTLSDNKGSKRKTIVIYDRAHKAIVRSSLVGDDATIDVSNLKPGIYFIYIEGSTEPKRILIE